MLRTDTPPCEVGSTFTAAKVETKGKMLIESNKYLSGKSLAPFSPPIDISSPSSLRHITYGSGKPLALHVNVTFVPSLTTISLLVIDSTITGGTEILGIFFQIYAVIKTRQTAFDTYRQLEDNLFGISWDLCSPENF